MVADNAFNYNHRSRTIVHRENCMTAPVDAELMPTATAQLLGALTREFRPPLTNVVAGYIIALLLLGGDFYLVRSVYLYVRSRGFNLPWFAENEFSWAMVVLAGLGAILLLVTACVLMAWLWSLRSYRIGIYENGILKRTAKLQSHLLWTDIVEVQEIITYEQLPIVKGAAKLLVPKVASRSYTVRPANGEGFVFEPNSIKNLPALAKLLRAAAKRGEILWVVTELK
jgi:hypothetical protein